MGQECVNYGPMLIPDLITKLPQELNLQISRKCGKEAWDITQILKVISSEIEAREKIILHEQNDNFHLSGSALAAFASKKQVKKCLFCNH